MKLISINELQGEWRPFMGHWVSYYGEVKNCFGKTKLLSSEGKYTLTKTHKFYIGPLLATVFQIQDYEKLKDNNIYCVSRIDASKNYSVDNIKIITKKEIGENNGKKSRQSETFREKQTWSLNIFNDIESVKVSELPNHTIYKNGEISNDTRWLTFSKSGNYLSLCCKDKSFKVHRLVCYAFHPIIDKTMLEDYKLLEVNHKDVLVSLSKGDINDTITKTLETVAKELTSRYKI